MPEHTPKPWDAPGWLDRLAVWTAGQLAGHGLELTGRLEEGRARPWSALWRAPTNAGLLWVKACAPAMKHEAALIDFLQRLRPDLLPAIYGVDKQQGLILMGDGGSLLRPFTREGRDLTHWARILPLYAALQLQAAPYAADLLSAGVIDRRLERLPAHYDELLADERALAVGKAHGLTIEEHAHLIALAPAFAARCAELAALGIPQTIEHSDFHDGNILIGEGRYRFIDWGDACITHPFLTMLVTLRSIAYGLGIEEHEPVLVELRDRYLGEWLPFGEMEKLRRAMQLAYRLTMVNRALTWRRALATVPPGEEGEYADAVAGWMQEYLQAETKGGDAL